MAGGVHRCLLAGLANPPSLLTRGSACSATGSSLCPKPRPRRRLKYRTAVAGWQHKRGAHTNSTQAGLVDIMR